MQHYINCFCDVDIPGMTCFCIQFHAYVQKQCRKSFMAFVFLTGIILNEVFCFVEALWRIVLNLPKTKGKPKGGRLPPNIGG